MTEPFFIEKFTEKLLRELIDHMNGDTKHASKNSDCSEASHIIDFGHRCWNAAIERAAAVARLHDTSDTNYDRASSYRRAVDEITQNILKFKQEP